METSKCMFRALEQKIFHLKNTNLDLNLEHVHTFIIYKEHFLWLLGLLLNFDLYSLKYVKVSGPEETSKILGGTQFLVSLVWAWIRLQPDILQIWNFMQLMLCTVETIP